MSRIKHLVSWTIICIAVGGALTPPNPVCAQQPGSMVSSGPFPDEVSTNNHEWQDVPGLQVTINSTGYPIVVIAKLSGVQFKEFQANPYNGRNGMGAGAHFQLLVDGRQVDLSVHEFHSQFGWELRDVTLAAFLPNTTPGSHNCGVQWRTDTRNEFSVVSNWGEFKAKRSLNAFEVVNPSEIHKLKEDLRTAILKEGEGLKTVSGRLDSVASQPSAAITSALRQELKREFASEVEQEIRDRLRREIRDGLLKDQEFLAKLKASISEPSQPTTGEPK